MLVFLNECLRMPFAPPCGAKSAHHMGKIDKLENRDYAERSTAILQWPQKSKLFTRHNPAVGIMAKFVERYIVEMISALERLERRDRDKIAARHVVRFTVALANVSTA